MTNEPHEGEELKTIATYHYVTHAETARMALDKQGFRAFLADREANLLGIFAGNGYGWIKLQVPVSQIAAARAYLESQPGLLWEAGREMPKVSDYACLACGAAIPKKSVSCPACGWTFDVLEDDLTADIAEEEEDERLN